MSKYHWLYTCLPSTNNKENILVSWGRASVKPVLFAHYKKWALACAPILLTRARHMKNAGKHKQKVKMVGYRGGHLPPTHKSLYTCELVGNGHTSHYPTQGPGFLPMVGTSDDHSLERKTQFCGLRWTECSLQWTRCSSKSTECSLSEVGCMFPLIKGRLIF
jgi:hypothetical protein